MGKWNYVKMADIPVETAVPKAARCLDCHKDEYDTWKKTEHSEAKEMEKIPVAQLRECGACHDNLTAHLADPDKKSPQKLSALGKSDQNAVCGKCHFNKDVFGSDSINPNLKHGLFTNTGFEGRKKQLSCLDCHKGHGKHNNMLQSIQAHTCFKCHKSAIVTMGAFQPINYVGAGKVCTGCHAPHGTTAAGHVGRMAAGVVVVCGPCHVPGHAVGG
jgi:hypothetical protein